MDSMLCQLSRNISHWLLNLNHSTAHVPNILTGPSVSFGWQEDFGGLDMQCNLETRANPSLRVSTCLNPTCSSCSSSIPSLLFLHVAPGVHATPHLLSQTEGECLAARPVEDESCRPSWLAFSLSAHLVHKLHTEWDLNEMAKPVPLRALSYSWKQSFLPLS